MRYIIITMLLGLFMLGVAHEVGAKGKAFKDGSKIFQLGEVCLDPKKAIEIAKNAYGELPIMEWSFANLPHFLFWNAETEAFTIFARYQDKLCVIMEGKKMRPTTPGRVMPGDPA